MHGTIPTFHENVPSSVYSERSNLGIVIVVRGCWVVCLMLGMGRVMVIMVALQHLVGVEEGNEGQAHSVSNPTRLRPTIVVVVHIWSWTMNSIMHYRHSRFHTRRLYPTIIGRSGCPGRQVIPRLPYKHINLGHIVMPPVTMLCRHYLLRLNPHY